MNVQEDVINEFKMFARDQDCAVRLFILAVLSENMLVLKTEFLEADR